MTHDRFGDAAEQEAIEAGPADPMTIGSAGQPAASSTTACRGRRPGVAVLVLKPAACSCAATPVTSSCDCRKLRSRWAMMSRAYVGPSPNR